MPSHLNHPPPVLWSRQDAIGLVTMAAHRVVPGSAGFVLLDRDRRFRELLVLPDPERTGPGTGRLGPERASENLPRLLDIICTPEGDPPTLLLLTDRSGETPLDRPGDELLWQELHAAAATRGTTLLDWFVLADQRWAFSVAEFAPTPAGWT
jgi:hypothetical protein